MRFRDATRKKPLTRDRRGPDRVAARSVEVPCSPWGHSRPRYLFTQLFWLGNDAQIGLWGLPSAGILFLRFFIRDVAADDDIITRLPVRRCRDFVLRRELNRVDDAQDFVEVPAGTHGLAE